jgi:hypothetical protein
MATWEVKAKSQWEAGWIEKLGLEEFEHRRAVAKAKSDEITDFEENCIIAPQIESLMMQLTPEQFAIAKDWPADRWTRFVYRVAGVK